MGKYGTFQKANNKGADQTVRLPLCCSQTPKDRHSWVEAHIVFGACVCECVLVTNFNVDNILSLELKFTSMTLGSAVAKW